MIQILLFPIIILAIVTALVFVVWAIVDIAKAKNKDEWKLMWILICLFLGLIGVLIYTIVGRSERKGKPYPIGRILWPAILIALLLSFILALIFFSVTKFSIYPGY